MAERSLLADFLRVRRESLQPEQVGLVRDGNRRVRGLRREEIARLADISADYYLRLEQGRNHQPSEQVLAALSRALRLDEDERAYFHRVARAVRPGRGRGASAASDRGVGPGVGAVGPHAGVHHRPPSRSACAQRSGCADDAGPESGYQPDARCVRARAQCRLAGGLGRHGAANGVGAAIPRGTGSPATDGVGGPIVGGEPRFSQDVGQARRTAVVVEHLRRPGGAVRSGRIPFADIGDRRRGWAIHHHLLRRSR